MPHQLTPDEIRAADLGRQFRGYDREQTEHLLAEIAEEHAEVLAQRDALSRQIGDLEREHSKRDAEVERDVDELSTRLRDRERRIADLEAELNGLKEVRSNELEEARGLDEQLSAAQASLEQHRSELVEHREVIARLRTREKALAEQVAMLESQLAQMGEAEAAKPQSEGAQLDERAVRGLTHLDRVVEIVEREARHEAERILKKARERADHIFRSAEANRERRPEEIAHEPGVAEQSHPPVRPADTTPVGDGDGPEPRHVAEYETRPVWDLPVDLRPGGEDDEESGGMLSPHLGFGEPSDPVT